MFLEKYGRQFLVQKRFFYVFFNIFSKTSVLNFLVFFLEYKKVRKIKIFKANPRLVKIVIGQK
jgi:hypothetical protein